MASKHKKRFRLLIQLGVAALIALAVALIQGLSLHDPAVESCRHLCDGFFITSVIYISLGGLVFISTTGFFDMFSYGVKSLAAYFTQRDKDFPHFYDFKCEQDAKRQDKPVTYTVLYVGLICLALSFLLLALFNHLFP